MDAVKRLAVMVKRWHGGSQATLNLAQGFGLAALLVLNLSADVAASPAIAAEKPPVLIGLDAEFGHQTSTSANAVRQGMMIAIDEINQAGGVLKGRKLELVVRDNRSIPAIGVDNLRDLAAMPDLVGVFGGKYSPVVVEWIEPAHQIGLPIFATWSSADQISEHSLRPNYIFRLSLKDAWAAPALLGFARKHHKAERVGLLLANTAWGRSNHEALTKAAAKAGVRIVKERWYNWGDSSLIDAYLDIVQAGAQVLILVANEAEGSILVKEVASLPPAQRLPIVSHWGVTGGNFAQMTGAALDQVDFSVNQTFSFANAKSPVAQRVLKALKERYGLADAERILSPVGIAHAYDLTHLLARAINQAGSTDRRKIRDALENLPPYDGLVKRYARPFTPQRHDALGPEQVFMARYSADDRLLPISLLPSRQPPTSQPSTPQPSTPQPSTTRRGQ
jgi:branched-chain amino acid transport system substrate-binding protein